MNSDSAVVKLPEESGIVSAYRRYFGEDQGKESRPTIYLYRHETRPFHIDYIFIPENWADKLTSVEVGEFAIWSKHSDHSPVIVELANDLDGNGASTKARNRR